MDAKKLPKNIRLYRAKGNEKLVNLIHEGNKNKLRDDIV